MVGHGFKRPELAGVPDRPKHRSSARFRKFAGGAVLLAVVGAALLTWRLVRPTGADADDPELVALGAKVYGDRCASCHGLRLEGQPDWRTRLADGTLPAPPHDETGHSWHHPDAIVFEYTKKGGQALAPPGFKSAMPSFAAELSDRDIWAALAYIKSRWPKEIQVRQKRIDEQSR